MAPSQTCRLKRFCLLVWFENDIDFETDPVDIGNTGFAWYRVTDIIESRERALDEVRSDVVTAWKNAERTKRNADLASEILKEIKGGKSLEALALERDLTVEAVTDVTRQGAPSFPVIAAEQGLRRPGWSQNVGCRWHHTICAGSHQCDRARL